jgi:GTP cyclohydrolase III
MEQRYRRALVRTDKDRGDLDKTYDDLRYRDKIELGLGVGNAIAMADHIVINDSTLEDFRDRANALLKKLKGV